MGKPGEKGAKGVVIPERVFYAINRVPPFVLLKAGIFVPVF